MEYKSLCEQLIGTISLLQETIEELKEEMSAMEDRIHLSIKNLDNNMDREMGVIKRKMPRMQPMTMSSVIFKKKIEERLTKNYVSGGISGLAKFVAEHLLVDENGYLTYSSTSNIGPFFIYYDSHNRKQYDDDAKKLWELIKEPLLRKSIEIINDSKIYEKDISTITDKFRKQAHIKTIERFEEIKSLEKDNSIFLENLAKLVFIPNN